MPAYFIQPRTRLNGEPDLPQVERDKSTLASVHEGECSGCQKQRSRMLRLSHLDRVDPAGRAKMFFKQKKVALATEGDTTIKKVRVTFPAEPTFGTSDANDSPWFIRKSMRSWLAQGAWAAG